MNQDTSKRISRLLKEVKLKQFMEKTKEKQKFNDEGKPVPDICPKCGSKVSCVFA